VGNQGADVMSKQKIVFSKALGDVARELNSDSTLSEKLQVLVKAAARALGVRGCSLMLLDSQKRRLFHTASHGLSERYLRKGFLEIEDSLAQAIGDEAVRITDVATDPRIHFRELASKEHVASILSVPVKIKGDVVGVLRGYSRTEREFTAAEEHFFTTVADLTGVVLESSRKGEESQTPERGLHPAANYAPLASQVRPATFAHPSEEEFARILDFYQIEWVYEPRSFALHWEGKHSELFTPDFYLPALDLYIEMTTLKRGSTSEKHRRIRRMRELYPEVNVRLLARRDYDRLLAKYGHGPLAGAKTRGVGRVLFSATQIDKRVGELARAVSQDYQGLHPVLVGVLRGVFCFMADLTRSLTVPVETDFMALSYYGGESGEAVHVTKDVGLNLAGRHVLLVEDIVDTGMTLSFLLNHLKAHGAASLQVCTLLDKRANRLADVQLKYVGFEVPDEFVVGYGLDYQEEYRNLPFIALMESSEQ
jgi:bifunctional protein TilS/HprT